MLVSITSKGQLTLPKGIRDQLGLVFGSKLDFSIEPDGSLRARPLAAVRLICSACCMTQLAPPARSCK